MEPDEYVLKQILEKQRMNGNDIHTELIQLQLLIMILV